MFTPERSMIPQNSRGLMFGPGRELVSATFRSWHYVVPACVIFTVGMIALLALRPRTFHSTVTFVVKHARTSAVATPYADGSTPVSGDVTDSEIATDIQLLNSHNLHVAVVRESNVSAAGNAKELESAVLRFEKRLRVIPVPKTALITVMYEGASAAEAQRALDTLAKQFPGYTVQLYSDAAAYAFFQQQAGANLRAISAAQEELAKFEAATSITVLAEQKDITVRKMAEAKTHLSDLSADADGTAATLRKLHGQLAALTPRIVTQERRLPNQYSVEHLGATLLELKNQRTRLLTQFVPADRRIVETETEIAETERDLKNADAAKATEQVTDMNPLRQSIEAAEASAAVKIAGLEGERRGAEQVLSGYEAEIARLAQATGEHDRLQMNLKQAQDDYALYQRKAQEGRITSALDEQKIANVGVAEPPTVPLTPESRFSLAGLLGIVLGNLVIAGICLAVEMRKPMIHTPAELEQLADIPVVLTIPWNHPAHLALVNQSLVTHSRRPNV